MSPPLDFTDSKFLGYIRCTSLNTPSPEKYPMSNGINVFFIQNPCGPAALNKNNIPSSSGIDSTYINPFCLSASSKARRATNAFSPRTNGKRVPAVATGAFTPSSHPPNNASPNHTNTKRIWYIMGDFPRHPSPPFKSFRPMQHLLNQIKGRKILVVGDLMLDRYIFGDAYRISPEAPVPVVDVDRQHHVAGGAANVAFNLQSLGARAEVCGWVGQDPEGDQLHALLDQAGILFDKRFHSPRCPTIVKTRVMVRNQQLCRLDQEAPQKDYALQPDDIQWILSRAAKADAVILSDYGKGLLSDSLVQALQSDDRPGRPILAMDPKPRRPLSHKGLDLLTPNRSEALQLAKLDPQPHEPFPSQDVCRRIHETYAPKNLVITLGPEGMLLGQEGKELLRIPTTAREVFDVSGAGDTVVAALTLALACKAPLEKAARFANHAAGIVVGKVGTATVTPQELLSLAQSL